MRRRGILIAVLSILTAVPVWAWLRQQPDPDRAVKAAERLRPGLQALFAAQGLTFGAPVFLRIFKQSAELELFAAGEDGRYRRLKTYPICRYSGSLGPKLREGDRQSPEGFYAVTAGNLNPKSRFHLSFNLGFPNRYDRAHGRTGSFLMVHGACSSIGCYAMTDPGIEEIYAAVAAALENGQSSVPVHIFPFRPTEEALRQHAGHRWHAFWRNLRQGYDFFERNGYPPDIVVKGNQYAFRNLTS